MATRTPAKKKAPRPDRRKPGASELISALLEDLTNNKNLITELPTEQQNDAVALILKRLQDHRVARLQHTKQQLDFSVSEHEAALNNARRLKTIISGDFTIIGPQ